MAKKKVSSRKEGGKKNFEFDSPMVRQGTKGDSWPQNEELKDARIRGVKDPMGFLPGRK